MSAHASHFLHVVSGSSTSVVLSFHLNINSSLQTVSISRQKQKMEKLNNALKVSPDHSFNLRGSLDE